MSADYGNVPIIRSHLEGIVEKIEPDIKARGYKKLKSMVGGVDVYQALHNEFKEKGYDSRYGYMYLYNDGTSLISAVQIMNRPAMTITISCGCFTCLYLLGISDCPIFGWDLQEFNNLVECERFILKQFPKVRNMSKAEKEQRSRDAVKRTAEFKAKMWKIQQEIESKKAFKI